mmetsp:Transcript_37501/g.120299  ORF Transcript_37501/g.120299 Transcript_37501/m.120299 type:complete len:138 (-) Transcript_37501:400-813(-)
MAEADLCVREEEDWLVVGHDEEPEFQVEAPFESDEFFPPPPFAEMMDASFSTERQEARTQEARTAFLAEAKRFDDFFLVDREMCEATKFDIAVRSSPFLSLPPACPSVRPSVPVFFSLAGCVRRTFSRRRPGSRRGR